MRTGMRALAVAMGAVLTLATVAGPAAGDTEVVEEGFRKGDVEHDDDWFATGRGGAVAGWPGKPCLTAGTNTAQTPIPGCQSPAIDPSGSGVLRLTPAEESKIGLVAFTEELDTDRGLDATFKMAQWGGGGADGIAFFFSKGVPSTPGAGGGSLGYETDGGDPGLPNALLGIGFDEFGNFSGSGSGTGCPPPNGGSGSPDRVVARGPGNGFAGYCFLGESGPLAQSLHGNTRAEATRTVHIDFDADNGVVDVDLDGVTVLQIPAPKELRESEHFHFGFTAATGGESDNHEVWDLEVTNEDPEADETSTTTPAPTPQAVTVEPTFTG